MICLVFENLSLSQIAINQIAFNYIRKYFLEGLYLDKNNNIIATFDEIVAMSDEDKLQIKLCGKNAKTGDWNTESGFSTAYAIPQNIYNTEKYFFVKPDDEDLMQYVTNYEEQEYDNTWFLQNN